MKRAAIGFVTAALCAVTACSGNSDSSSTTGAGSSAKAGDLKINQVQLIGSHNSYHIAQPQAKIDQMVDLVTKLHLDVGDPRSLAYTHAPLATQLDRGVRSFELDVNVPAGAPGAETAKVEHITGLDTSSTCPDLARCIADITGWMAKNPDHVPIPVLIELKTDFTPAQLDVLDRIVRTAAATRLLDPDAVRGDAATLRDAVESKGWPKLSDAHDKMFFMLDNGGTNSERYRAGHANLTGRALFTTDGLGDDGKLRDDAAVLKLNDPGDGKQISGMVAKGFFVRTRADADLAEAKANDTKRRDIAFSSGAQVVSTDYPPGEPRSDNGYLVSFGGKNPGLRCDPVSLKTACPADLTG